MLTAEEAAARLRLPKSWLYRAAQRGEVPHLRFGRYIRFDQDALDAWVAQQRKGGQQ